MLSSRAGEYKSQTIVEAATELLGIKDIKAGIIHQMLNTNYDGLSGADRLSHGVSFPPMERQKFNSE